ncbi:hypothetical protein HYFRA_00003310 [Hymenoscyphus fraxineus]|uniref:Uncharacterized protein n=1 Tax=Hymenoscyphus fraxineus TaxID=746836 RepID=A0A9N9KV00_9HELO|nr:hypothetical protein HYFRA_00003310 [Hymenoscyphus fraxineus]
MKSSVLVMIVAGLYVLAAPLIASDVDDSIVYPDFKSPDDDIVYPEFDRDSEIVYPDAYIDD